jgi:phage portal protein BeeE
VSLATSVRDGIRNALQTSPQRIPGQAGVGMVSMERGRVGKANVRMFRNWSEHSEWVRAAINIRKAQISGADWDITRADPSRGAVDTGLQREIKDRLEFANPKAESFRTFIEQVVEDILVLDAGSIEKERNLRGEPLYLHAVDGGMIRVNSLWDGTDPEEARYYWYPDNFERARFTNDDFIYIMETPRTNTPVGLSKLETLKLSIDSELEGHAYNARQVKNPIPDGLLHLGEGVRPEQVDKFKSFMAAEVYGRGAIAVTGGGKLPTFLRFHDSNRDAQFLEWQIYLVRKIAAVFGMNAGDLGISHDINRSTAEVNDQQTEDRGLRPLMHLLAAHLTREYVWDSAFGGQANNLKFSFTKLNLAESLKRATIEKIQVAGMPTRTVNEARIARGEEPLGPQFDQLMMVTPQTALSLEDIPSVREFMDSRQPKQVGPGGPPSDD